MAGGIASRFDDDARGVIGSAFVLASHRRRDHLSAEDLLIGATWQNHAPECPFRRLKEDAVRLCEGVLVGHLPLTSAPYASTSPPLNDEARRVVVRMVEAADSGGQYWIGVDHLLLGILAAKGLAASVMEEAGWTRERIVDYGREGRVLYPPKPWPRPEMLTRLRFFLRRYIWVIWSVIGLLFVAAILYLRSQDHD